MNNVGEQRILESRKMVKKSEESTSSSACFIGRCPYHRLPWYLEFIRFSQVLSYVIASITIAQLGAL